MSARTVTIAAVAAVFLAASGPAQAQTQTVTNTIATYLPVTLWTITGAVIGAVAWPGLAAGTIAITPIASTAALWNPGAAVGAVVGGTGYLATR
ncbi:hypothetical protein [Azospirillum sp. sgz301742]